MRPDEVRDPVRPPPNGIRQVVDPPARGNAAGADVTLDDVLDALARNCTAHTEAIALVEANGRQLSYGELGRQVDCATAGLRRLGLRPGDRVLFAVRPSFAAIVLILAVLRNGGVLVAADLGMGEALFAARMALVKPRWTIAESLLLALAAWRPLRALMRHRSVSMPKLAALSHTQIVRVGPRWPGVPASTSFDQLRSRRFASEAMQSTSGEDGLRTATASLAPAAGESTDQPAVVAAIGSAVGEQGLIRDRPAFVVFTSGTTEAPKAVVHTGSSLGASVRILADHLAFTPRDVAYSGDLHVIVPALLAGARVVFPPRGPFSARRFLGDVDTYEVTHAFGTPSDFLAVISHAQRQRRTLPAHLRSIMLGAAPVDSAFLARVKSIVPTSTAVWCVYAMTEMLPVARVNLQDKLARQGLGDLVGAPFPEVAARLAPDGELLLRGPHLFGGYFGQAALEEHATGDLATFDEQGRIVLLGRKKDMIIRGHQNVYPGLYEPTIAAIAGVRRCRMVGIYSDAAADERIVLAVEPEPDQELAGLKRRLRAELRSGPHSIDLAVQPDAIVFTRLPVAGRSNKVDKRALLELIGQHLARC